LESIVSEAAKDASIQWGTAAKVLFTDGDYAEVSAGGDIVLGRQLFNRVAEQMPGDVYRAFVRFVVFHELWHVKQLQVYGKDAHKAPDALRKVYECQADVMASYIFMRKIYSTILKLSPNDPIFKENSAVVTTLYAEIAGRSGRNDQGDHAHLSKYERWAALRFGGSRALHEVGLPLASSDRERVMLARVARITNTDGGSIEPAAWSVLLCKKITRYGSGILERDLVEAPPENDHDVDYSPQGVKRKFVWKFENVSKRSIRVSVTALSGYYPKGKSDDYGSHQYHDATSGTVDIAPGTVGTIKGEYRFTSPGEGYDIFARNWAFEKETLITAEYIGAEAAATSPVTKNNCVDAMTTNLTDPSALTLAAIMRIGGTAREGFSDIPKKAIHEQGDIKLYTMSMPVPGAVEGTISLMGRLTNATIIFYSGNDRTAASNKYSDLVHMLKRPCEAANAGVREYKAENGWPFMKFEPLTRWSSATVMVMEDIKRGSTSETIYKVAVVVSPR
jgi:hypothetical protein